MSPRTVTALIVAVAVLLLANSSLYIVKQTERAVLLRFGEVVIPSIAPGLHVKVPFADRVLRFDGRVLTLDSTPETFFTLEKKPLIVDWFAKWRILDVGQYYERTSGDEATMMSRLQERVNTGLRNQISRRDMHEVISGKRDELMAQLTSDLNEVMRREFGVQLVDVRVKRIDLPPEVSDSVYSRMTSEREIEARQHRATGNELALGIRADAERQSVVIAAEAYKRAEQARGEGDARASAIYADAFSRDAEFYAFYRSINAYQRTFSSKDDVLLLGPDSEFFRYLKKGGG
jgi:membrane protease subunit HflC